MKFLQCHPYALDRFLLYGAACDKGLNQVLVARSWEVAPLVILVGAGYLQRRMTKALLAPGGLPGIRWHFHFAVNISESGHNTGGARRARAAQRIPPSAPCNSHCRPVLAH